MNPSGPRPASSGRFPGVDGVRALAAGSIVLYHSWQLTDLPAAINTPLTYHVFRQLALGVTLFFTLSGFLLYRPFAASILRGTEPPRARRYLRNRALRIVPAYWVILLVVGVVLGVGILRTGPFDLGVGRLGGELLARNALLVQGYSRSTILTGIGPAWSLAVEVVFYLALPLLALVGLRIAGRNAPRSRRRVASVVPPLLLLVAGLTGKVISAYWVRGTVLGLDTAWLGDWHTVLYRSFLGQADLFTFGMLLAVVHIEVEDGFVRMRRWLMPLIGAAAVLLGGTVVALTESGRLARYPYDTLTALVMGLLLALVVLPGGTARQPWHVRLLETRPFVATGLVSYSLFLWHVPVLHWLREHDVVGGGFVLNLAVAWAVCGVLAALTYRFVELPALRRKRDMKPAPDSGEAAVEPIVRGQAAPSVEPLPAET